MKVYTKIVMEWNGEKYIPIHEESFEYEGPVALCDRWGQGAAKTAAGQAQEAAGEYGAEAQGAESQLAPFYSQEMRARHLYDPTQLNQLLTSAGAGQEGATAGLEGEAKLQAARTRNASGFTKSLDQIAREKEKASAGMSEGIAAQDVMGAKELQQKGAAGMSGLFNTDVGAQLKAMGQQTEDINAEVEAGKSGWLQQAMGVLNTVGGLGSQAAGAYKNLYGG